MTPTATASAPPHEQLQGDLDCDGFVKTRDAMVLLYYLLNLPPLSRTQPCRSLDNVSGGFKFADVTCDGPIDEGDVLGIIAYAGGFVLPQEDGCVPIGDPL